MVVDPRAKRNRAALECLILLDRFESLIDSGWEDEKRRPSVHRARDLVLEFGFAEQPPEPVMDRINRWRKRRRLGRERH
jgi:hypothetical protein